MTNESPYHVIEADLTSDRRSIIELWAKHDHDIDEVSNKLDWFYRANPSGCGRLYLLKTRDNQMVGFAGVGKRLFCVNGEESEAGIFVDILVASEHRTMFPALMLQRHVCHVGEEHADILYSFPNRKAYTLYSRINHRLLGEMHRFAKVLRTRTYIERRTASLAKPLSIVADAYTVARNPYLLRHRKSGEWLTTFDERFDELWRNTDKGNHILSVRDKRMLTWRFLDCPKGQYRIFILKSRNGQSISGYAVSRIERDKVAYVMDLLAEDFGESLDELIKAFCGAARHAGCIAVSFECFGKNVERILLQNGFQIRESRPALSFAGRKTPIDDSEQWYLTEGDEDW